WAADAQERGLRGFLAPVLVCQSRWPRPSGRSVAGRPPTGGQPGFWVCAPESVSGLRVGCCPRSARILQNTEEGRDAVGLAESTPGVVKEDEGLCQELSPSCCEGWARQLPKALGPAGCI
ncbi:hypothetical protein H1C71_032560, partial [Ictidomys tridecemlineatus]